MQATRDEFEEGEGFSFKPREILEILWRRRALLLQVFVVVAAIGLFASRGGAPIYKAESRINTAVNSYEFSIINSTDPFAGIMAAAGGQTLASQVQALESPEFQDEARKVAGIKELPNVKTPYADVDSDASDGIIVIEVEGGDPEAVAKLANTMAEMHLQRTTEQNEAGLRRAIDFLKNGQQTAERRVGVAQRRLADFGNRYRLTELTEERENQARRREALDIRLADMNAAVAGAEAELKDLQAAATQSPVDDVTHQTQPNPVVDRLQLQLDDLRVRREAALVDRPATSREVLLMEEQIETLRARLQAQSSTRTVTIRGASAERKALLLQVTQAKRELNKLRRQQRVIKEQLKVAEDAADRASSTVRGREYDQQRLVAERDAAKAALDQFTSRLADLELRKIARVDTSRIIARALPPTAAIPTNQTSAWATALVAAMLAAIVLVFVRDSVDDRLTKVEDVQKLTDRPVLVHVPQIIDVRLPLISLLPSHSPAGEAYRSLRFSLRLAMAQNPFKKLLVTSPSEGEGKTVTAVNLSIALALEGWKVILVDGDLRRPNVHRLLELKNDTGLSEVLGGLIPLEMALRGTGVANLRVLTSGPTPHNPSELLGGPGFEELANELTGMADVVIFDSPPCLPVTDPLLIGEQAGAVILVVQAGQTRKEAIRQALGHLSRVNASLLGLVINKVSRGQGYYGYHTYYGYSSIQNPTDRTNGNGNGHGSGSGTNGSSPGGAPPTVPPRSKERWARFARRPDKTQRH